MSSASSSTPSSCGRTARATRRSASFWRGLATVPSTPTPTRPSPSRRSSRPWTPSTTRLSELPVVLPEEHERLVEWNRTVRAWPDQAVPELVAAAASRCPDAPAVAGPDGTLTYAELVAAAAQVAGRLRRLGVAREH